MVHHTHMDIGYTDQPQEVLDQHLSYLDRAVELCKKNPNFRWTVESAYLVKDYLRCRPNAQQEQLFACLRNGQMELMAFEMQPLTELLDEKALKLCVNYAADLGCKQGFQVSCAMLDDIGGYAALLPGALQKSGIKYLVAGVGAFQVFMPWAALPHLFYLEDPEGKKILIWNLGIDRTRSPQDMTTLQAVYGLGANYIILPFLDYFKTAADRGVEREGIKQQNKETPEEKFRQLLERLEKEEYPYEELMLQYGGDNRWPSDFLPELIEQINARETLPFIELTTPGKFMSLMEEKYRTSIPVKKGVITDPWCMRTNPAPEALKLFLEAQRKTMQAEELANRCQLNCADDLLRTAREYLDLYSDHTCGICCWHMPDRDDLQRSPDDPVFENARQSWASKKRYAHTALTFADNALRILRQNAAASVPSGHVILFNHGNTAAQYPVEIPRARDAGKLLKITDSSGKNIPFQNIGHNTSLILSPQLPPRSSSILKLQLDPLPWTGEKEQEKLLPLPEEIVTDFYKVVLDKQGFISGLFSQDGRIRYSRAGGHFLDILQQHPTEYELSWEGAGMKKIEKSVFPTPQIISCGSKNIGNTAVTVEQRGVFPDGTQYRRCVTFYQQLQRIDTEVFLDKPAHRNPESFYFAAELADSSVQWKINQNSCSIDPDRDLLPGAMQDLFYAPQGAEVKTNTLTAVMHSQDVPLLHPGSIRFFQWEQKRTFTGEPAAFYWQIYHNMLITDCPSWQRILCGFNFSLSCIPAGEISPHIADDLGVLVK